MRTELKYFLMLLLLFPGLVNGQKLVAAELDGTDTIPTVKLHSICVIGGITTEARQKILANTKLMRNLKIVMPYAIECSKLIQQMNAEMALIPDNKKKKEYLKKKEKELFDQFEHDLKNLTFSQGKLLIKLIDRQTGSTSYNLIKEYKSGASAFMWNGIASLFGASLKESYNQEEEQEIEVLIAYLGFE